MLDQISTSPVVQIVFVLCVTLVSLFAMSALGTGARRAAARRAAKLEMVSRR